MSAAVKGVFRCPGSMSYSASVPVGAACQMMPLDATRGTWHRMRFDATRETDRQTDRQRDRERERDSRLACQSLGRHACIHQATSMHACIHQATSMHAYSMPVSGQESSIYWRGMQLATQQVRCQQGFITMSLWPRQGTGTRPDDHTARRATHRSAPAEGRHPPEEYGDSACGQTRQRGPDYLDHRRSGC